VFRSERFIPLAYRRSLSHLNHRATTGAGSSDCRRGASGFIGGPRAAVPALDRVPADADRSLAVRHGRPHRPADRMKISTSGRSRRASAARASTSWRERVLAVNSTTPWLMIVRRQPTQERPSSRRSLTLGRLITRSPEPAPPPRSPVGQQRISRCRTKQRRQRLRLLSAANRSNRSKRTPVTKR